MAYQPLRLTVTLETVTPLFLGGAVPGESPELRPSSFRGVMRYWLRAALGNSQEPGLSSFLARRCAKYQRIRWRFPSAVQGR